MELSALAHRVLFEGALEAKMTSPAGELTDEAPGRFALARAPAAPERARGLEPVRRVGVPFKAHDLGDPEARGRVLHFFANHELQAVELMALVLLRHPEAPPAFRMELGRILVEEQDHLRGYLGRMQTLGVQLGALPLSGFFWRTVADAPTTQDFLARLCLTFEQANLDHCQHFAPRFRANGDDETAALLDSVYADEIGHVMHGVRWFEADGDLFEAWRARLKPPLSPARAKREPFDETGRRKAGLPDEFVDKLRRFSASTGRTPVVHQLCLGIEERAARSDWQAPKPLKELEADLAAGLILIAPKDDVVRLPRSPSPALQNTWWQAGLRDVEIQPAGEQPQCSPHRVQQLSRRSALELRRDTPSYEILGPSYDRLGFEVTDETSLQAALQDIAAAGHQQARIKAMWSSSGRHQLRWLIEGPDKQAKDFVTRQWAQAGSFVVEPELPRIRDFGVVFKVGPRGLLGKAEVLQLLSDQGGRFIGHVLDHPLLRFSPAARRRLGTGRGLVRELQAEARRVAIALSDDGYRGFAGIDALVYGDDKSLQLQPLVEINTRLTFGHLAANARRRIAPGRSGLLLQLSARHAKAAGLTLAQAGHALQKDELEMVDGRWRQGNLLFTDPDAARQAVLVLMVGQSTEALHEQWLSLGLPPLPL